MDSNEPIRGDGLTAWARQLTMARMIGRRCGLGAIGLCTALSIAQPAAADLTVFGGATRSDASRPVLGAALGLTVGIVGLEFEYANARGDASSLQAGMFNVLLLTPPRGGIRVYGTVGGGLYRDRLVGTGSTGFGASGGGGISVGLIGPLRMRLDYRRFRLGTQAARRTPHRVYVGVTLAF